ncbi:glycosyltransferase family 4 protein [Shewanella sp.]|uniref:glycosyltransferase family 4 protein n=1 Tax=Shewanella sp. TaxID=50422 RepID=UPI0040471CF3
MKISLDATGLGGPKTGTAVYLAEILNIWNQDPSVVHEFIIFASKNTLEHLSGLSLDCRFRFVSAPSQRQLRVLWQQIVMPLHIARFKVDLHWGAGFVLPLLSTKPMVVTVHDLTFQLFPAVHERIKRFYFPLMIKAAVVKARTVISISESTHCDLHRLIPASRGKSVVTLLAARRIHPSNLISRASNGQGSSGDYVLFVGTVEPRKNLTRLIRAWKSMDASARSNVRLIIVGATGWLVDAQVANLKAIDAIEFRGHVDDAELVGLLQGAIAFVYPSLYEGFGLPVVEAMSLGIPVLTSDIGATREVAQGAAVLVDPTSEDNIREGLARLIGDPSLRQSLATLGRERAASFSWARTAGQTLEVLEKAANE